MNTFKKFDYVRFNGDTYRVNFIDGPYVYLFGETRPVHHSNCALVSPKFKNGDVVRNRAGDRYTIDRVKTQTLGMPHVGPLAYEYTNDIGFDYEEGLTLIRRPEADAKIAALVRAGKKIEAIKEHRTAYGTGLLEAKNAVESIDKESTGYGFATPSTKFKVGDRVEVRRDIGDVGTVRVIKHGLYGVLFDSQIRRGLSHHCGDMAIWSESELVAAFDDGGPYNEFTRPAPHIVAIFEHGKYRPNSSPHIHDSRALAEKEAARLAVKHPGSKFGVFALVSDTSATAPLVTTVNV